MCAHNPAKSQASNVLGVTNLIGGYLLSSSMHLSVNLFGSHFPTRYKGLTIHMLIQVYMQVVLPPHGESHG